MYATLAYEICWRRDAAATDFRIEFVAVEKATKSLAACPGPNGFGNSILAKRLSSRQPRVAERIRNILGDISVDCIC